MSYKVWGAEGWRGFNRVDEGDLPVVGGRRLGVPGVRAAVNYDCLPDEMRGVQGDRIRHLLGHRRQRGRASERGMDE